MPEKKDSPVKIDVSTPKTDCDDEDIAKDATLETGYDPEGSLVEWDFEVLPIKVIVTNPNTGYIIQEEIYDPEDWTCLQDFLNDLRSRLPKSKHPQLLKDLKSEVENLRQWKRDSRNKRAKLLKDFRMCREKLVEQERIRDTVGLERGVRARRDLEQIASVRLSRWSTPAFKKFVRFAREAVKT